MASIVIPAHNEERGIERLLRSLGLPDPVPFEVIVVANGCTDRTGSVARRLGATVIETPVASKVHALALGDARAGSFPRLYVDGDVVIRATDVEALCDRLSGGIHAAGPDRVLPMTNVSRLVRWYYDIWTELDGVQNELYGRGVVAVDQYGHDRFAEWPDVMSDDMFIAMSFTSEERAVAHQAKVIIWPPKTYRDLVRRRIRVVVGNALLASGQGTRFVRPAGSSVRSLLRRASSRPSHIPRIMVFVSTAALARLGATLTSWYPGERTWLRDQSSRD